MSRDEAREFLEMIFMAFPKWQHKIEEIIALGNKVVIRAIDYTTHEGEFQDIPATGNELTLERFNILERAKLRALKYLLK